MMVPAPNEGQQQIPSGGSHHRRVDVVQRRAAASRRTAGIDRGSATGRIAGGTPRGVRSRCAAASRRRRTPRNAIRVDVDAAAETDQSVGALNDEYFLMMRTKDRAARRVVENCRAVRKRVDEFHLRLIDAFELLPKHHSV